ncbi:MAG: M28 family peptidase [Bryobacteraceae bacterium]|nr:M28 family peptidase [Bryobacteraceae bacterium]
MYCTQALIVLLAALAGLSGAEAPRSLRGETALEFTRKLVAFGPRPSGSPAHASMQAYLAAQLRLFGCATEELPFQASTPNGPVRMKNILVRVPGTSTRPVVITGHYDTKVLPGFAGANDGGSSAGLLLELARVLCGMPKKADPVWLVWLDGEEAVKTWSETDSLYGSRWLASKWKADGTAKRIKALVNIDMIGDRDLNLVADMNSSTQVRELFWGAARELGYGQYLTGGTGAIEDDHIPFARAGIPVLDVIDFDYGPGNSYWHTDRDTMDKLSARSFQVIGDVLLRVIKKLGGM